MRYEEQINRLRQVKEQQTIEKLAKNGYMDEDDYGSVLPPYEIDFDLEFNDSINNTFYGAKAWGENFRKLMEKHPVYVDADDAIAGRFMYVLQRLRPFESAISAKNMEMAPIFDYSELKKEQEKYCILPGIGKMHHFAGDYQIGLELGYGGLLEKVRKYSKLNPQKQEFYQAEENVIIGIQNWISRTVIHIEKMLKVETNPIKLENLKEMYDTNAWLIENPPRNFREVCQWMAWNNMAERTYCRAGAGCQLDETLRPYYEKDLAEGKIDKDKAVYIIACLLLNDPHYYQIAGPDENGNDMTSEISFMILEAAHLLKTTCNLTIRYHKNLNEDLFRFGLEILLTDKKACPRFSGDEALVKGFMKNGYSYDLARKRIAVGCNWMSLPGLEYTQNDLIKINLAKVFEVAYEEFSSSNKDKSVTELYENYVKHLQKAVLCVAKGIDFHMKHQYLNAPELMLNLLSHGPIEKGLDASHGGMEYYNIAVDGSGLAVVADSFAALEQRVEKEKKLSWQEVYNAVKNDFAGPGGEKIRKMLSTVSHYGKGGTRADAWAIKISENFTYEITKKRTPDGFLMIPGLFSWANTIMFGKDVGATPDGRHAFTPINHGANPQPGFRKDGAFTAMSNAIASVQCGYGNTAPFQLELDPTITDREEAINIIGAVIKTHFDKGGTLLNINILNKNDLLEAYNDPTKHTDLIVRVTGFTAYFATLSPEFKKLIINRVVEN